ncbi:MAG: right-handed parallel beta-helix repeat-containing protein [Candidatus Anammoximicrobium sp.]|nr:right-handed parallel beta-helix repeat-containing protein [Candidatus Anammoximicrobium sp.]
MPTTTCSRLSRRFRWIGTGCWSAAALLLACSLPARSSRAETLEVGPGKRFARIEEANAQARPGDAIMVYPRAGGQPYERTAVYVRQARLTFRAVPAEGSRWVKIDGSGFEYSGRGSTPRAVFQFNAGTDDCVLEGFELSGAHNGSHNGAGVRINQANNVIVRRCSIHHNDMGIMSNGDGGPERGLNQLIEFCEIHHNGDPADPGFNHNLYLGGTSVTLRACEVHASLTGHNVKSRAHHNRIEDCYIHGSANREFDLVDAADTTRPDSHAVLLGNVIVKDPNCSGNRGVIHFGQDGGKEHDGTLHLAFNTIVTPFISPVVELSAFKAKAQLIGNLVWDAGRRQNGQKLIAVRAGAGLSHAAGAHNRFGGLFAALEGTAFDRATNVIRRFDSPPFAAPDRHDYRLLPAAARQLLAPLDARLVSLPATPGAAESGGDLPLAWQYRHPAGKQRRETGATLTLGACGLRD